MDPDNAAARTQVGQIATAVRQFDRSAPGRRWAQGLPPQVDDAGPRLATWVKMVLIGIVVVMAFSLGYVCGVGVPAGDSSCAGQTAGAAITKRTAAGIEEVNAPGVREIAQFIQKKTSLA